MRSTLDRGPVAASAPPSKPPPTPRLKGFAKLPDGSIRIGARTFSADQVRKAEALFLQNRGLAGHIARRTYHNRPDLVRASGGWIEIRQVAEIALWQACLAFDASKGWRLSSYAARCVWSKLRKASAAGTVIRVPQRHPAYLSPFADKARTPAALDADDWSLAREPDDGRHEVANAAVEAVLARLHPDDAALLRMHYLDGMTLAQIGRVIGVADKNAVGKRIAEIVADAASEGWPA